MAGGLQGAGNSYMLSQILGGNRGGGVNYSLTSGGGGSSGLGFTAPSSTISSPSVDMGGAQGLQLRT